MDYTRFVQEVIHSYLHVHYCGITLKDQISEQLINKRTGPIIFSDQVKKSPLSKLSKG